MHLLGPLSVFMKRTMLRSPLNTLVHSIVVVCCLACLASACASDIEAPLADAAERQHWETVKELIKQGADANAAQIDGMTALHWSVYYDEPKIARLLVAAGADANAENRYGVPPLSLACQNGNPAIVRLLLAAGADPNATLRGGETVLMTAARARRALGRLSKTVAPVGLLFQTSSCHIWKNRPK